MMRRIVDSVSLMVDSGSQHSPERANITPPTATLAEQQWYTDISHQQDAEKVTLPESEDEEDLSSSPTEDSSSDSLNPNELSEHFNGLQLCEKFGIYQQSSSVPNRLRTKYERSPSPEYPRFVRPQSPSPGRPLNVAATENRRLPGGFVPPFKKIVQTHKKKENTKILNDSSGASKSDNFCSPVEEKKSHSTGVGVDSPSKETGGTFSEADPLTLSVECLLLPFYQNLQQLEMRVPTTRLSQEQRRLLKTMCGERDLLILSVPSTPIDPAMLIIRKRAALIQKQQVEFEQRQREAEERARQRALEEEARLKQLREEESKSKPPVSSSCQVDFDKPNAPAGRKKYRRLRNERRRQARATKLPQKPKLVDREMQTVPEDYWLCPWCMNHIAPEAQCGHEVICRAGVKQKQIQSELQARLSKRNLDAENRRRLRLNLPPVKPGKVVNNTIAVPGETAESGRSRSRTRQSVRENKGKKTSIPRSGSANNPSAKSPDTVQAQLNHVHPNDLNALTRLMQRVCSEAKCTRLSDGIKCSTCRLVYCAQHRPVGLHVACPKPVTQKKKKKNGTPTVACGLDVDEKREFLKQEMRKRRTALMERRQRF